MEGIRFRCKIQEGKLSMEQSERQLLLEFCKTKRDGLYDLVLKRHTEKTSDELLKYIWACLYAEISDHTGQDVTEIHEILKTMFLSKWIDMKSSTGEVITVQVVQSLNLLTGVSEDERLRYIDDCRKWAFDFLGISIPGPKRVGG